MSIFLFIYEKTYLLSSCISFCNLLACEANTVKTIEIYACGENVSRRISLLHYFDEAGTQIPPHNFKLYRCPWSTNFG